VVEDGLREYIPAVRRQVLDTIAAGRELLANTISLILIQAREILFFDESVFYLLPFADYRHP
jgi:hypothetical protein